MECFRSSSSKQTHGLPALGEYLLFKGRGYAEVEI